MYNKTHSDEKTNTRDIGLAGEKKPIYIVKHLLQINKSLHALARHKARELKYKFVWIKQRKIFMRKSESSNYIYIRDKSVIDNLK